MIAIILIICFGTLIANLFILWINIKLYTEYFKEKVMAARLKNDKT